MRRVAVTGVGAVTPLGLDSASTWEALVTGRSGIGRLETFDVTGFPVRIAGQVRGFRLTDTVPTTIGFRHLSRAGEFGVAAAWQALADAHLEPGAYAAERCGIAMGASVGRPDLQWLLDVGHARASSGNPLALVPYPPGDAIAYSQNIATAAMSRMFGASGPMIGISTACSGSGHAIGEAYRAIQEGDAVAMLAGGYDSLTTWTDVLGFSLLGALNADANEDPETACRPFDRHRAGFVLGEGAAVLVLEDLDAAHKRGATVLAEIVGYGSTLNAWRITDSPADGNGAIQAMEAALATSPHGSEIIDYVVAHGTGTHGNDASETMAIKKVFGARAYELMISSPKSMTGHLTSAAAALNTVAAIYAMRDQVVPPTANLTTPDPKLDLDYVPLIARRAPVGGALVNAFAFGGTNTSLALVPPEK
ncbi:beta-ketoacyl-[acyl-carrier-protein] synthase family protein [Nocardia sp. BSTN01]|uniref:beta-ketoacyl-[acyl-carrier-protein] synthase family protein n=1 Tax=Nocardia sp. BSTN01 TaxID=2783665 RepID=UPI00188E3EA7|nr:beta-ketoacyl-[acyl-carrier-protein] synthase family protein [Nocardia sp. BSTN01]MBF5002327.1 beta-ketoacyl-[acyl-carrier-protein] synthase family protein [Nocardia sp. BSTN01]